MAAAFNDPERLWTEHQAVRESLLASEPTAEAVPAPSPADLWARTAEIHRRMIEHGILPPSHGAN